MKIKLIPLALALETLGYAGVASAANLVTIVADEDLPPSARQGLAKLEDVLWSKGLRVERVAEVTGGRGETLVLAGLSAGDGPAAAVLDTLNAEMPGAPQALVVRRTELVGKPAVVLCGSDAVGLMFRAAGHGGSGVMEPTSRRAVSVPLRHNGTTGSTGTLDLSGGRRSWPISVTVIGKRVTGLYEASIPADFVTPNWDLMYFVEAVDTMGNGRVYPDLETETPHVIIELER